MTTAIAPDTTALEEELDFELACRLRDGWTKAMCCAPAKWLIIKTCCGAVTFNCTPHLLHTKDGTGWRTCRDCRGRYYHFHAPRYKL